MWDIETQELLREFQGHGDQIWSVRFSPDGRYILTGSADLTARLWEIETGAVVRQFVGHQNSVQSVGFSPDGNYIVTSDDQAAYLWHTSLDDLIDFACTLIPRQLSLSEQEIYGLVNRQSVCDMDREDTQIAQEAWTPHPPLPTSVPLVLGEESVFEFEFFPMPVAFIEGMHVPAPDVHILMDDGTIMRPDNLDESVLNAQLYASTQAIPMDFIVPPYDAGPYERGVPLGFTMMEWIAAGGHGRYSVGAGGASLDMEFENLRPNAIYTVWCARVNLQEASISDAPCGKIDGSNNAFTSDADGNGVITIELPEALQPSTENIRTVIAIAYHSDGQTYGYYSGDLGRITHQQLVYEFPFE